MAGYSTLAPTQTLPTTNRGGYTSAGVYRQALGGPQVGPRDYQYSLDPGQEAELQTIYGDIAGAQQAELGGIRDFIGSLEGAEQRGRRGIQAGLGQGIAAKWGGAGMGGPSASQLRQAGLEGGLATAQFEAETLPAIAQARYEAQGLLAEKTQAIDAARAARMQEIQGKINELKKNYTGLLTTDTGAVARDLSALALTETDPVIRAHILAEAGRIRSTPMNLFTNE